MIERPRRRRSHRDYEFVQELLSDSDDYDEESEAILEFLDNCCEPDENAEYDDPWTDDEEYGIFQLDEIEEPEPEIELGIGEMIREPISTSVSVDTEGISTDTQVDIRRAVGNPRISTGISIDIGKSVKNPETPNGLSTDIGRSLKNPAISTALSIDILSSEFKERLNLVNAKGKAVDKEGEGPLAVGVPFPEPKYTKAQRREFSMFKQALEDASVILPFSISLKDIPKIRSFVRTVINNKDKVEGVMETFGMGEVHTPRPKLLEKKNDPGQFTIPCRLGDIPIKGALADTGANINVMTKKNADKLGITKIEPYTRQIALADATTRTPIGVAKDLPINVEGFIVPTDFVVVEAMENEPAPLILGRPFLATVGARLDFEARKVVFTKVKYHSYPLAPSSIMFCGTISSRRLSLESIGENRVDEDFKAFEVEIGLIHPQELCDAVMTDEVEEPDQEERVTKYHAFTELLEDCLAKDPSHEERFHLLLKALHKVIPKLLARVQKKRVSRLKSFLSKFFSDMDRANEVFESKEVEDEAQMTRQYFSSCLPHQRMQDVQALDGSSLNSLFVAIQEEGSPTSTPSIRMRRSRQRQQLPAYRIPTLAQRATAEEQTLLLKPIAFYEGAIHYKVMNRGMRSPFSHFRAVINQERVDANRRAEILNTPIKVIMKQDDEQDATVPEYHGSLLGPNFGPR